MKNPYRSIAAILVILALLLPSTLIIVQNTHLQVMLERTVPQRTSVLSDIPQDPVPLSRVTIVGDNPDSYIDDFSYMAAIPGSLFCPCMS